jgi:hypothetical protein
MKKIYIIAWMVLLLLFLMVGYGNSACEGDINCNGTVDGSDVALFAADFGTTGCGNCDDVIARIDELENRIAQLEALLLNITRNENDIYIDGANLHIRSGSGYTADTVNGLGNLIVGYNEQRGGGEDDRSGSHNIVVGRSNNFSSYGGLVVGYRSEISGNYASVSGGTHNTADGYGSSVSGGFSNTASNENASVSGGEHNTAGEDFTWVSGGSYNTANEAHASVSGGYHNIASGSNASISGGRYNRAIGYSSFIGGGGGLMPEDGNLAVGNYSAILGGFNNRTGDGSTVEDLDKGRYVNLAGTDTSIGEQSTVSGGYVNTASGNKSSVSGGYLNRAVSSRASVTGGSWNTASGGNSSVSGGQSREAPGANDWAAGTLFEEN